MLITIREVRHMLHPNDYWEFKKDGRIWKNVSSVSHGLAGAWTIAFPGIEMPTLKEIYGTGPMERVLDHYETEINA